MAITVTVAEAASERQRAPSSAQADQGRSVKILATGLDDPTDLAPLPDGRLLVSERSGRIRVLDGGVLHTVVVADPDLVTGNGRGLLSLAVDPDFAATRTLFVAYTTEAGLRTARVRLLADALAEQAIVVEGMPIAATQPRAVLRVGPDRKLYLAIDDNGSPHRAADLGDPAGKLLRLNPDGTSPRDQPASPVYLAGLHRPTGLAWTDPGWLWLADSTPGGMPLLRRTPVDDRSADVRFALPAATGDTRIAAPDRAAAPSGEHDLLAANDRGLHGVLRIVSVAGRIAATTVATVDAASAPIRAMTFGVDGAIYACTGDALLRIDAAR